MDVHFPGHSAPVEEGRDNAYYGVFNDALREINYITVGKIQEALASIDSHKAAGPDGFKPIVLKNLPNSYFHRLQIIYTSSLYAGYVPACWRRSKVMFIQKPGKDDYTKAKSFCPITLTSHVFKTMEKVILNHLENVCDIHKKLKVNQHSFCKGSSCNSALSDMVDEIESLILCDQYALVIFIHIRGAFDNLNVDSSIRGMRAKCLPPPSLSKMVCILSSFLISYSQNQRDLHNQVSNTGDTAGRHSVSLGVEPGVQRPFR